MLYGVSSEICDQLSGDEQVVTEELDEELEEELDEELTTELPTELIEELAKRNTPKSAGVTDWRNQIAEIDQQARSS